MVLNNFWELLTLTAITLHNFVVLLISSLTKVQYLFQPVKLEEISLAVSNALTLMLCVG